MLYGLVITIHIITCLVLIAVILLQAGRGGGLSETFGGGDSSQTIFGTKMSVFFTRATVIAASMFLITCLVLGIMTSRRGRSLIRFQKGGVVEPVKIPAQPSTETATKETVDKEGFPLAKPNP